MKTLIPILIDELKAGRNAALATVLQAKGSAPRGPGACQLLLEDGSSAGTVGGGALEHRALAELASILKRTQVETASLSAGTPDVLEIPSGFPSESQEYALTQDEVKSLGMVCGGNVSILYQAVTPSMLPFFQTTQAHMNAGESLWLLRVLERGRVTRMQWVFPQQENISLTLQEASALCKRKPVWQPMDTSETQTGYWCEPVLVRSRAYLFGGGHVSQRVAPLLAQLDFSPVMYDDRPEFASEQLFSKGTSVLCAPFSKVGELLTVTAEDEIVIMTRGHANDLEILTFALRTPAYYIGLIGSKSKIAYTKALILSQGFTDTDFARVHTPIGLPILAETPMEIAVSVAAEMIMERARHTDKG